MAKVPIKQPTSIRKDYYTNHLIVVYLHFLRNVATRLNCSLIKFQTDGPTVPFHSEEMVKILWWLMSFFIQKEVLKAANSNSSYKLSRYQVSDERNFFFYYSSQHTSTNYTKLKEIKIYIKLYTHKN